uniref:Uncharacterized protein n=1 Tax=Arundo donax TaxID=35708 RepID=A0A0A9EEY6_ARUDO
MVLLGMTHQAPVDDNYEVYLIWHQKRNSLLLPYLCTLTAHTCKCYPVIFMSLVKYPEFSLLLFSNKHPIQCQVILDCVWLRTM